MHFSLWGPVDKSRTPAVTSRNSTPQNNALASTPRALSIFEGLNISFETLKGNHKSSCRHKRKADQDCISPTRPFREGTELPVELWLEILQHALNPQFELMMEAVYHNIQFFYTALTLHSLSDSEMKLYKRTRANLRLVCRAWKLAVDRIDTHNPKNLDGSRKDWIKGFDIKKAVEYGPCTRFDTCLKDLTRLRKVHAKRKYQHAVKVINLQVQDLDPQTCISCPDLTYLLAKSWTLTALHISFISSKKNTVFPTGIVQNLPSLRTLSIVSDGLPRLCGQFKLRFLTALFITFTKSEYPSVLSGLGEWEFPNLHSLSVDARGWPHSDGASHASMYACDQLGLGSFLRKHRSTLRSIRMIPFSPVIFQSEDALRVDPSLALELSALETLVTDFVQSAPWEYYKDLPRQILLPRVKHLVHISTRACDQESFATGLLESLQPLPSVQSISIIEEPRAKGAPYIQNKLGLQEVRNLDIYCQNKGIRIYDDMGFEICCVESAWKQIVRGKVQKPYPKKVRLVTRD